MEVTYRYCSYCNDYANLDHFYYYSYKILCKVCKKGSNKRFRSSPVNSSNNLNKIIKYRKLKKDTPERVYFNQLRKTKSFLDYYSKFPDNCIYCNELFETYDHLIPLSKGGTNDYSNIVKACNNCNISKGTSDLFIYCKHKNIDYYSLIERIRTIYGVKL